MNIFDDLFGKLFIMNLIPVIIIFIIGKNKNWKTLMIFFLMSLLFTLFHRVFTIL